MSTWLPLLPEQMLQKIALDFLNSSSAERTIDGEEFKEIKVNYYPVLQTQIDLQINYSYERGTVDSARFEQANALYVQAYNGYKIAQMQTVKAYNSSSDQMKQGMLIQGVLGNGPKEPKKPNEKDYLNWESIENETLQEETTNYEVTYPENLPDLKEIKSSFNLTSNLIPIQWLEIEKIAHPQVSTEEINKLIESNIKTTTEKAISKIKKDLSKFKSHRNLTTDVKINSVKYAILYRPLCEVSYDDPTDTKKNKAVYIDELNGVIDGQKLIELELTSRYTKNIIIFALMVIALYNLDITVSGETNFGATLGAATILFILLKIVVRIIGGKAYKWLSPKETQKVKKPDIKNVNRLESYIGESKEYSEFTNMREKSLLSILDKKELIKAI